MDYGIAEAQDQFECSRNSLRQILPARLGYIYVDTELHAASPGFSDHARACVGGSDVKAAPRQSYGVRAYAARAVKYSRARRQGLEDPDQEILASR